jgi:hypothetical protein
VKCTEFGLRAAAASGAFKPRWSVGRSRCRKDTDSPRNQAIRKRAKAAGFLTPVGCHTWTPGGPPASRFTSRTTADSNTPSRWLAMNLREQLSCMTGQSSADERRCSPARTLTSASPHPARSACAIGRSELTSWIPTCAAASFRRRACPSPTLYNNATATHSKACCL